MKEYKDIFPAHTIQLFNKHVFDGKARTGIAIVSRASRDRDNNSQT